ncbi:MAG: hypothetical protein ACR2FY_04050 [Pirellulaceae bacterium]
MTRIHPLKTALLLTVCVIGLASPGNSRVCAEERDKPPGLLFRESFDDSRLLKREWYDGEKFVIAKKDAKSDAKEDDGCLEFHWPAKGTKPDNSDGVRRLFEPTETIYLRCHLRLSKGWGWTGRNYHPHLIQFMTTENGKWHGPAASHLTVYIEPVNGKLRLAAQDIQNKDRPHGLTQGPLKGGYNGELYDSKEVLFKDDQWHCVEALFQLNSLDAKTDKPKADGIVRGWFDGKQVIDRTDVVLRSTDFPKMKFNQLLVLPYFGPGLLPHEQTLWLDELAVGTQRLEADSAAEKP